MKTSKNNSIHYSYSCDCPHCGETTYSDVDFDEWQELEYGDGYPYGSIKCPDCGKDFYIDINEYTQHL